MTTEISRITKKDFIEVEKWLVAHKAEMPENINRILSMVTGMASNSEDILKLLRKQMKIEPKSEGASTLTNQ